MMMLAMIKQQEKIKLKLYSKNVEVNSQINPNIRPESSSYLKSNTKLENTYNKSQNEHK